MNKSFEDYYYGLRLDYEKTKFHLSKNSCGVIQFKSEEPHRYLSSLLQTIWIIHLQHMVLHQVTMVD